MDQKRTNEQILEESNQMLKKALNLTCESEEIAEETLNELYHQREILHVVETNINEIDVIQDQSIEYINSMTGFWGYLMNLIMKIPIVKKMVNYNKVVYNEPEKSMVQEPIKSIEPLPILELSDSSSPYQKEIYNKNEELLWQLCGSLDRLVPMATQMSCELDYHNHKLKTLDQHIDDTTNQMRNINHKCSKI